MERPKFKRILTQKSDFCEISSEKPVETFVPHQAISIAELVSRFERGQRLNVHSNFAPGSNFENISDEEAMSRIKNESMETDDFPPTDVYDVADVERHYSEHQVHKSEFKERQRKKREEAQQEKRKQSQQADEPTPPAPPVQ